MTERGSGTAPDMEAAAWAVLGPGLRGETSPFDPAIRSWTSDTATDLLRRVVDEPDLSQAGFLDKLERQLEGASRGVVLLAAELLYLRSLPLVNLRADTKRANAWRVLSCTTPTPAVPPAVDAGFDAVGAFNGGQGFNAQAHMHLAWLCRFVRHWWDCSDEQRANALADPAVFAAVTAAVPGDHNNIRMAVNYLAWPGAFESIVNARHKRWIRDAFTDVIDGATGEDEAAIDRDLLAIRTKLQGESGSRIHWYEPPYVDQWWATSVKGHRAWLVRPRPGGAELVERWRREGFVSLAAARLGEVPGGSDLKAVRAAVEDGYRHQTYAQRLAIASEYHHFLTGMKADDLVVTVVDDELHLGVVEDDAGYVGDPDARLRRPVSWSEGTVPVAQVAGPVTAQFAEQGTVVDVTKVAETLGAYLGDADSVSVEEPPAVVAGSLVDAAPPLASVTDELADSLHMPRASLQEIVDLLADRQQLVFYGPPGTGKTFLSQALASHVVGRDNPDRVRLVQFHPSYSYEDFFEGFRPEPTGKAGFVLQRGPLRQLADEAEAEDNRGAPFVLVIDEMNRTNLAKVFGELYFLLEYRDHAMQLQYNPAEKFRLPRNLFIVGTMNTADRSIAMVDAAIRRRFPFVELHPDEPPVSGVLESYLRDRPGDQRAQLLAALNSAIEEPDRDMRIGPSYLMRSGAETESGLRRIWTYDVLPLLEEHYYGRLTRRQVHERFGLDALRVRLDSASSALELPTPVPAEADDPTENETG